MNNIQKMTAEETTERKYSVQIAVDKKTTGEIAETTATPAEKVRIRLDLQLAIVELENVIIFLTETETKATRQEICERQARAFPDLYKAMTSNDREAAKLASDFYNVYYEYSTRRNIDFDSFKNMMDIFSDFGEAVYQLCLKACAE